MSTVGDPIRSNPQNPFLMALGLTALLLFMGVPLVLVGTGVVRTDDAPGVAGRIALVVFGTVISMAGVVQAYRIMRAFSPVPDAGAIIVVVAALVRLVQRITWTSMGAALLVVPLAWSYQHPEGPAVWWRPSADMLMSMVLIEFLLIHGFPFLVFAASLVRVADGRKRIAFGAALAGLILLYGAFAWSAGGGWQGVAGLAWVAAPNVLAFLHSRDAWAQRMAAISRWAIRFIAFFGIAMLMEDRTLTGAGTLPLGARYFAVMVGCELFRVFELPVDLSAAWVTLPAHRRRNVMLTS